MLDISRQGLVVGTVAYMSPEQARGKHIDERTDIWAFGCVLYEMLAGKAAFRGDTPTDIIVKIAAEEPDWNSIPRLPDGVSAELELLIRRCLRKDVDARYPSVRELAEDIEAVHQGVHGARRATTTDLPPDNDDDFVLPSRMAPLFFMLVQVGYMAFTGLPCITSKQSHEFWPRIFRCLKPQVSSLLCCWRCAGSLCVSI